MPDDAPRFEPVLAVDILRAVEALHADVRRLLASRERPEHDAEGMAALPALLPQIVAARGSGEWQAREIIADPRIVTDLSARMLGRLLARAEGRPVGGLIVRRYGCERGAVLWTVERLA